MRLEKREKGLLFVISAPAGTGKTTLVHRLIAEFPDNFVQSCSCTTRAPRPQEVAMKDYQFLTRQEFEQKIAKDAFLEYARVYDDYYGTLKEHIETLQKSGKSIFLVIDTQGALQLMKKVEATFIFIAPPSEEILKLRLQHRDTESADVIEERLCLAKEELALAKEYDYQFVNDDLDTSYDILRSIVIARHYCQPKGAKKRW